MTPAAISPPLVLDELGFSGVAPPPPESEPVRVGPQFVTVAVAVLPGSVMVKMGG